MTVAVRTPPASTDASLGARAGVLVDVAVLSNDLPFYETVRAAIGERNPVWRARSAEETADLLLSGRCGVLLVDLAAVPTQHEALIARILEQFPDLVVVAAGKRDDEALLSALISEGRVFRFLHLPSSAQRAAMFVDAAIREHVERRGAMASQRLRVAMPAFDGSAIDWRKGAFVGGGVLAFIAVLALAWQLGKPAGVGDATPIASGAAADPVLSRARAALAAGRYESPTGRNALDLYRAVLLTTPDNDEAQLGLDRTVAAILATAETHLQLGREAEARRLLERVRAVSPEEPALRSLGAQLGRSPEAQARIRVTPAEAAVARRAPPATAPVPARIVAPVAEPTQAPTAARSTAPVQRSADTATPPSEPDWQPGRTLEQGGAGPVVGLPDMATTGPAQALPDLGASAPSAGPERPRRLHTVPPEYPVAARAAGREGTVTLSFRVDADGRVADLRVTGASAPGVFDEAARRAVRQWRYAPRPGLEASAAGVETVELKFALD